MLPFLDTDRTEITSIADNYKSFLSHLMHAPAESHPIIISSRCLIPEQQNDGVTSANG